MFTVFLTFFIFSVCDDDDDVLSEFEALTGWRINGSYQSIPAATEQHMKSFFQKYNDMLFELLDIPPYEEWNTPITNSTSSTNNINSVPNMIPESSSVNRTGV